LNITETVRDINNQQEMACGKSYGLVIHEVM